MKTWDYDKGTGPRILSRWAYRDSQTNLSDAPHVVMLVEKAGYWIGLGRYTVEECLGPYNTLEEAQAMAVLL